MAASRERSSRVDRHRAGEHDRGVGADLGGGPDPGAGLEVVAQRPKSSVADEHRGGAVDDAGGVAGVVDVIDLVPGSG